MTTLQIFLILLLLGALAGVGTFLHSFAVAFDIFCQDVFFNDTLGVTLSSRAGLAARTGYLWPSKAINLLMFSNTHCEDAITADIERATKSLQLLTVTS